MSSISTMTNYGALCALWLLCCTISCYGPVMGIMGTMLYYAVLRVLGALWLLCGIMLYCRHYGYYVVLCGLMGIMIVM